MIFFLNLPLTQGSRKKVIFFSGPATKALHSPPLELSGHIFFKGIYWDFFRASTKFFFLAARPIPPPPCLSGRTTKKKLNFFRGFPYETKLYARYLLVSIEFNNCGIFSNCTCLLLYTTILGFSDICKQRRTSLVNIQCNIRQMVYFQRIQLRCNPIVSK